MVLKGEYKKYSDIYNELKENNNKIVLLYQLGKFYEIYEFENAGNATEIADLLNIQITRKNKNKSKENKDNNPAMCGIPIMSYDKYIDILYDNKYTVGVVNQEGEGKNVKRLPVIIHNRGTNPDYIMKKMDSSNTICLYFETVRNKINIGMCCIDFCIGNIEVYEIYQSNEDTQYIYDELVRFVKSKSPLEINIYYNNENNYNNLIKSISGFNINQIKEINKSFIKISYQNEYLKRIYNLESNISSIEYLDLEKYPLSCLALVCGINTAYSQNAETVKGLKYPIIWEESNHLILDNNTIDQLDLMEIYRIINFTKTKMGARKLKYRLLNPIINKKEIKNRLNRIEYIMSNKIDLSILEEISDIERLFKKIILGTITLQEFGLFYISICYIYNCYVKLNKFKKKIDILPKKDECKKLRELIAHIEKTFDIDELLSGDIEIYNILSSNFEQVNKLNSLITDKINKIKEIKDTIKLPDNKNGDLIRIEKNEIDGYHFVMGKTIGAQIKKLNGDKFHYKILTTSYKIVGGSLTDITEEIKKFEGQIKKIVRGKLDDILSLIREKYNKECLKFIDFISELDLIESCGQVAKKYGYCKPIIISGKKGGSVNAVDLRHPLVERISNSIYVPNDANISGPDLGGTLVFGVNASGKTCYIKSIGINVIMAQAGLYVSAKSFEISPYKHLMTRLSGNDNIMKGESSFEVEMIELKSIIMRSGAYTLALGDELCRGTTNEDAIAIVYSAIRKMKNDGTNFIFATHLHSLTEMDNLDNIRFIHLKVKIDKKGIIYSRKIEEGAGPKFYGIEIAGGIGLPDDLIKDALMIRKKILNEKIDLVCTNTSKYNSGIQMTECEICKKNYKEIGLDTHHIKFQKYADEYGLIDGHIDKNKGDNLVVLCKECHKGVHRGNIEIKGWINSIGGKVLDFIS